METLNNIPNLLWWLTAIASGLLSAYFKDYLDSFFSFFSKALRQRLKNSREKQKSRIQSLSTSESERLLYIQSFNYDYFNLIASLLVMCLVFLIICTTIILKIAQSKTVAIAKLTGFDKYYILVGFIMVLVLCVFSFQIYITIGNKRSLLREANELETKKD